MAPAPDSSLAPRRGEEQGSPCPAAREREGHLQMEECICSSKGYRAHTQHKS